ncbi:Maltodextrin glucosidase [compost metagenome]
MISYFFIFFLPGIPSIYYGDEIGLYGQKDPFCRKCFTWNRIDKKILRFFKSLSTVRNKHSDFLSKASFEFFDVDNEISIYLRSLDKRSLVVIVNRSDSGISIYVKLRNLIQTFSSTFEKSQINILFSIGKHSCLDYLDPFGAILIDIKS